MKKIKRQSKKNLIASEVFMTSKKCDAILLNLLILRRQISIYPQSFIESIDNLQKAAAELQSLYNRKIFNNGRE